jgi:hypothetical protein
MVSRSLGLVVIVMAVGSGSVNIAPAVMAAQTRQVTIVQEMAPVGLALSQTLRYTWANLAPPEWQDRFEPLRVAVRLLADDGTVLAQDAAEAVGSGRFQVFDFSRGAIGRSGDATTARLQVRVEATIVGRSKFPDIVLKRGIAYPFDDAVEIIDEGTEATVVAFGRGVNELSLDDTAAKEKARGDSGLIGVVPGQSLRLTAANPLSSSDDDRKFKPLFAFTIFDAEGKAIVEGAEVALEPGQSQSFEVPYSALATSVGLTGRVQARVEARRTFHGLVSRFSQGGRDAVVLEIVDALTGQTTVHLSQKPKEIVVVGSKIEP